MKQQTCIDDTHTHTRSLRTVTILQHCTEACPVSNADSQTCVTLHTFQCFQLLPWRSFATTKCPNAFTLQSSRITSRAPAPTPRSAVRLARRVKLPRPNSARCTIRKTPYATTTFDGARTFMHLASFNLEQSEHVLYTAFRSADAEC